YFVQLRIAKVNLVTGTQDSSTSMRERIASFTALFLMAAFWISAQTKPSEQDRSVPAELIWITCQADEVRQNAQGYWEVALKNGIVLVYVPAGEFAMGSPHR
ncbi:MAG: hypothetical protein M0C28_47205, partial [Candidatus Moduliflexus flocculans]|nr:hypothetical protein [Candidatus Moduliflexus flocculans]